MHAHIGKCIEHINRHLPNVWKNYSLVLKTMFWTLNISGRTEKYIPNTQKVTILLNHMKKKKGVGVGVGVLKTIHPMGEELSWKRFLKLAWSSFSTNIVLNNFPNKPIVLEIYRLLPIYTLQNRSPVKVINMQSK